MGDGPEKGGAAAVWGAPGDREPGERDQSGERVEVGTVGGAGKVGDAGGVVERVRVGGGWRGRGVWRWRQRRGWWAWLGMALGSVGTFGVCGHAQVKVPKVPLVHLWVEAEGHRDAGRWTEAAGLAERVLQRVEQGEALPSGLGLDQVRLLAAGWALRAGTLAVAEVQARRVLESPKAAAWHGEARLIRGVALLGLERGAEAETVLEPLAADVRWRDRVGLLRAVAARAAGRLDRAAELLAERVRTAGGDEEKGEAAWAWTEVELERGDPEAAWTALKHLLERSGAGANPAAAGLLALRTMDLAARAQRADAVLAVAAALPARAPLLAAHAVAEAELQRRRDVVGAGEGAGGESVARWRREQQRGRLAAARAALEARPHFDADVLIARARAYHARGQVWEAALVCERLLARGPADPHAEEAAAWRVRALAESRRPAAAIVEAESFARAHPRSPLRASTLGVAAGAAAGLGDGPRQVRLLAAALAADPAPDLRDVLRLRQAQAWIGVGAFTEAWAAATRLRTDSPDGPWREEARYLEAMASLAGGESRRALAELDAYRREFPEGRFSADASYREAAAQFGVGALAEAERGTAAWLQQYPEDHPQRGEVLSLRGDVLAAATQREAAAEAYRGALTHRLEEEGRAHALDELTRLEVALGDGDRAVERWRTLAAADPDQPLALSAAYWIGRILAPRGDASVAAEAMAALVRPHLADPGREQVERVLAEIARTLGRASGEPPGPADTWLLEPAQREQPTARARARFLDAEFLARCGQTEAAEALLDGLEADCPLEALPPALLARQGDRRRTRGDADGARRCYESLLGRRPPSRLQEVAHVGLGELALAADEPAQALDFFERALRSGAPTRMAEASLGRAVAWGRLGRREEARAALEERVADRALRGETKARAWVLLGQWHAAQADAASLAQAQACFERVRVAHRRFTPWRVQAVLDGGHVLERLGRTAEAETVYRESLADPRVAERPEAATLRSRLARLTERPGGVR